MRYLLIGAAAAMALVGAAAIGGAQAQDDTGVMRKDRKSAVASSSDLIALRGRPFVLELDEPGLRDAVGLGGGDRKDDALSQVLVRAEAHLDIVAIGALPSGAYLWARTPGALSGRW